MSRPSSIPAWIIALTIGALGWGCCAWLLWQHAVSQKDRAEWQRRLEEQDARHDLAERRFKDRNAELSRQVAALNGEIDELVTAQGRLAAIEERRQQASERLLAMEAKKKAAEVATAALALRHEVMKSKYAASELASLGGRQLRLSSQAPATDARRKILTASSQLPVTHAFREGLYAFAKLEVSKPESEGEGGMSITRQAAHARSVDARPARSIKAAFNQSDAPPQSPNKMDWAKAQFELGQALAAKGRSRSGTSELKEAVLAFRAAASEWSRENVPLKWATVQFELGQTLALLGRRSGDPSVRRESITALGSALDILVQAGEQPRAAEAQRLLDEMAVNNRK